MDPLASPVPEVSSVELREHVKATLERLSRTGALPALPAVATAALAIARDPRGDVERLCRIVQSDVGITARVVRIANSVFYGRKRPARNVKEAVTTVGLRKTCDILVVVCARQLYDRAFPRIEELWDHALAVGIASEVIAAYTERADPARAFLPGLLHDVGRIAFLMAGPTAVAVIDELAADEEGTSPALEREWYGFDHAQAGAMLTCDWGLERDQCEAIRWHHEPKSAGCAQDFPLVVSAADRMAYDLGHGTSPGRPSGCAMRSLGISAEDEAACVQRVRDAWASQRELLA